MCEWIGKMATNEEMLKEHVLGVLMYLFENYMRDNTEIPKNHKLLLVELEDAGFGKEAAKKALEWLDELNLQQTILEANPPNKNSMRIFTTKECKKIDKESRNLLIQLERMRIINSANREIIISQLMHFDDKYINIAQVKWVTLMVLFNGDKESRIKLNHLEYLVLADRI
jgi:Smg protein